MWWWLRRTVRERCGEGRNAPCPFHALSSPPYVKGSARAVITEPTTQRRFSPPRNQPPLWCDLASLHGGSPTAAPAAVSSGRWQEWPAPALPSRAVVRVGFRGRNAPSCRGYREPCTAAARAQGLPLRGPASRDVPDRRGQRAVCGNFLGVVPCWCLGPLPDADGPQWWLKRHRELRSLTLTLKTQHLAIFAPKVNTEAVGMLSSPAPPGSTSTIIVSARLPPDPQTSPTKVHAPAGD